MELSDAADDGGRSVMTNVGSHAHQFRHMHETGLEYLLPNDRNAIGHAHKRHELGLQVGRKTRECFRCHINAA